MICLLTRDSVFFALKCDFILIKHSVDVFVTYNEVE